MGARRQAFIEVYDTTGWHQDGRGTQAIEELLRCMIRTSVEDERDMKRALSSKKVWTA